MGCCGGGGSFLSRRRGYQGDAGPALATRQQEAEASDPATILKQRLARGEINPEEYQRLLEIVK